MKSIEGDSGIIGNVYGMPEEDVLSQMASEIYELGLIESDDIPFAIHETSLVEGLRFLALILSPHLNATENHLEELSLSLRGIGFGNEKTSLYINGELLELEDKI